MNNQSEDRILGYVGTYPVGDYNAQTEYEYLNVVTHKGSSYVCIKEEGCTAVEPPNDECWQLFAGKGDTGEKGDKGDTGPIGPKPVNGVDYNTNAEREEFKNAVVADSKTDLEKYIAEKETQLDNYTKEKETKLDDYVTDTVKPTIDTYVTDTTKKGIDAYEKEKEKVLDTYTDTKKTEIDNYVTNTSKPALDKYEKDKEAELETAKNTAISEYDAHAENVLTETDDLFNALDTEKASGTELYIEDAKPCRIMNTEIGGMYKQETTTETQLANFKNVSNIPIVDGTVDLSSKTEGFSAQFNIEETTLTAGNYCFYFLANESGNVNTQNLKINENTVGVFNFLAKGYNYCDFTLTEDITCSVLKLWLGAQWCNKTLKEISLIKGTHSDITKYEPYTGGIPSPSPDYPQAIEQIESIKLIRDSSNLFNITDYNNLKLTKNGNATITKTENAFSFVTTTDNYCGAYIVIDELKKYIDNNKDDTVYNISFDVSATKNTNFRYGTEMVKNTTINTNKTRLSFAGILSKPFTLYSMSQEAETTITISNIKVTKNEDVEYTSYRNQTISVDLKGNKLCAVSDTIKDKLLIDRNGNVALQKNIGNIIFNGTEDWKKSTTYSSDNFPMFFLNSNIFSIGMKSKSNYFTYITRAQLVDKTYEQNGIGSVDKSINIKISTDLIRESTLENFKNWLSTHNTEVYYTLATPEIIDLGQLTELPKTFGGINNIWAETNLGNTEIEIEYVQDVKKLLEKQAEQQNARLDNIEALLSTTQTSALLLDNMQNDLESEVE